MPEFTPVSARISNFKPSPDSMAGVQQIVKEINAGGVPRKTLELVHIRASQINRCNNRVNTTLRIQPGTPGTANEPGVR